MKNIFKSLVALTGLLGLTVTAFTAPALADSPGQLGGGPDVYQVKNLTKGGGYANTINADPCDQLQYSIRLHNAAYGGLTNIAVKVNLPGGSTASNTSTMTATPAEGAAAGTSGTATVNLSAAQSVSYQNGTAQLFDANGGVIKTLSDSLVGSGVNIGDLNGSTTEFVNFKAKINCPTPPPPAPSVVCDALTAEYIGSTNVPAKLKFTAKGTATGGAVINGYSFDFGDGVKQDSTNAVIEHTYNAEGEYKATVQVKSTLGVTNVVERCSVTIKVSKDKPPVVVPPTQPPVTPGQPGAPGVPSVPGALGSPSSLPSTGPVEVISGLLGTSSLGYGIRQWLMSRRRLGDVLNK